MTKDATTMKSRLITVAAIQMASGDWNLERNMDRAEGLTRQAAGEGANLVLCPELFMSPYFCIDENSDHFDLAEPLDQNEKAGAIWSLGGGIGNRAAGRVFLSGLGRHFYNSLVVFDADGSCLGVYRKTHVPDSPGYSEKNSTSRPAIQASRSGRRDLATSASVSAGTSGFRKRRAPWR
ncbi:nitrilase-related carbon-nitrogen hydrolase [Undibacterium arcticum]